MTPSEPSSNPRHRIVLVDDHAVVRQGIALMLNQEDDLEVCGEAESANDALDVLEQTHPDAAIVDLKLKDSSGMELIKDIRIRFPEVRILVLSMRDEGFYAERVLRAGAMGYVTKEEGPQCVLTALRSVLNGTIHVSERMATKVMSRIVQGAEGPEKTPIDSLSDRELEIFEMIGQGLPTREIASRLHISPKTVDSHREHIKTKLQIDSATDLLKHAIQWVQMQEG